MGQFDASNKEVCETLEPFLRKILSENTASSIVIHEAAEALGNISESNLRELLEWAKDEKSNPIVRETCELALDLTQWREDTKDGMTEGLDLSSKKFQGSEPSPPFHTEKDAWYKNIDYLKQLLLDPKQRLFDRYRAMFTLRELCSNESALALCEVFKEENMKTCSELLRHEVAFVLGELGRKIGLVTVPHLERVA
jgi:deoxyhypusine monooxygenase